ncbi:HlyD family efflux transporter periplasmic adaptor subunit [Gluconacetobacter diazotrophicus]|uniref:HlyD family efflux transporter periplasmic adaptor subunit n=1 Tax=Gluconacetobacter diazotrophicus TaxID=33996 RepID=A0A7W4NG69_GLUDI|nr:efflux RND transporter periplasmic adaptor subunit [Gluconacetobacter diazotrophicus]MBB2157139.1 HlyD family efflux transporter periplasmic adaptor subunit [Gluconacetobacter diazotrophicus]
MKWACPLFLLLAALCGPAHADAPGGLSPVTMGAEAQRNEGLVVVTARAGTLSRVLPALARVVPDESRVVPIQPVGSGKVLRVHVMAGQHVARDAVLVDYLDHSLHVARLQAVQMRAALDAALAARDEAYVAWRRARDLSGSTVSEGETRRRLAVLQEARNTVLARQADVGTMTHRFHEEFNSVTERSGQGEDETSSLLAPVEGTVQSVGVAVGGDINAGQTAAMLVDLSRVWIVSDVPPQDAARLVQGGAQTTILGTRRLASRIGTIDGMASPATGLVRVISTVPNPDGALRPGMMLETELETDDRATGIVVPSEAVQQVEGRDVVFVRAGTDSAGATIFRPVPVTVGLESGGGTVILSGLSTGQPVAAQGSFALKSILLLAGLGGD